MYTCLYELRGVRYEQSWGRCHMVYWTPEKLSPVSYCILNHMVYWSPDKFLSMVYWTCIHGILNPLSMVVWSHIPMQYWITSCPNLWVRYNCYGILTSYPWNNVLNCKSDTTIVDYFFHPMIYWIPFPWYIECPTCGI